MVQHLNVNQWKNAKSVNKWFTALENKTDCVFIKFDIREFYPSITEDALKTSLSFANDYQNMLEEDIRITNHCRISLLFSYNQPWKKKDAEGCFDVTMGSYDGTENCELVGIYILSRLSSIIDKNDCGLYRDGGLLVFRNVNGQKINRIRKKVIQLFKDSGFLIDIETNLKIVNFLDITFNLSNGTFKPYKKPNDLLLYKRKVQTTRQK